MHTDAAPAATLRVVLDTNAWLDLLLFEDPRCGALREDLLGRLAVALVDAACQSEWERVLAYPDFDLDDERKAGLIARQQSLCQVVDGAAAEWPLPRCRDPDDQKFLALARDGAAHYLLTRDHALLVLAGRLRRAGRFTICTPEAFSAR